MSVGTIRQSGGTKVRLVLVACSMPKCYTIQQRSRIYYYLENKQNTE